MYFKFISYFKLYNVFMFFSTDILFVVLRILTLMRKVPVCAICGEKRGTKVRKIWKLNRETKKNLREENFLWYTWHGQYIKMVRVGEKSGGREREAIYFLIRGFLSYNIVACLMVQSFPSFSLSLSLVIGETDLQTKRYKTEAKIDGDT